MSLRNVIGDIINRCSDADISSKLKKLSDKIKYCDPISIAETKEKEAEIAYEIEKLRIAVEKLDIEGVDRSINTVCGLIDARSRIGQMNK